MSVHPFEIDFFRRLHGVLVDEVNAVHDLRSHAFGGDQGDFLHIHNDTLKCFNGFGGKEEVVHVHATKLRREGDWCKKSA